MSVDCIFCRIIEGEIHAHRIFEDDETLAFLDANPLSRGHTIVVPKSHVARLEKLSWKKAEALFKTTHKLISKVQDAVKAPASTIAINNGPESGQEIPHIHVHIIPRFRDDFGGPIHAIMRKRPQLSEDETRKIAQRIRAVLQKTS